jgi:Caspase domain
MGDEEALEAKVGLQGKAALLAMGDQVVARAVVAIADWMVRLVTQVQMAIWAPEGHQERSPWCRFQTRYSISWGLTKMRIGANIFWIFVITVFLPTTGICQQSTNFLANSSYVQTTPVRRLALVISNQVYDHADEVTSADADTKDINSLLQSAGFTMIRNVSGASTKGEILSWAHDLANAGGSPKDPVIFFFYFAGHGFQSGAWPFLVPTSVDPNNIYDQSLSLNDLIDLLSGHRAGLAIFVVDACRNIISATSDKTIEYADAKSKIKLSGLPAASVAVIDLSTEYDTLANNTSLISGGHSPYAFELVQQARISQSLSSVFQKIESRVKFDTHEGQMPVYAGETNIQHFFLVPGADEDKLEAKAWQDTLATNRKRCVALYSADFPASPYAVSALSWLDSHGSEDDTTNALCPTDLIP